MVKMPVFCGSLLLLIAYNPVFEEKVGHVFEFVTIFIKSKVQLQIFGFLKIWVVIKTIINDFSAAHDGGMRKGIPIGEHHLD